MLTKKALLQRLRDEVLRRELCPELRDELREDFFPERLLPECLVPACREELLRDVLRCEREEPLWDLEPLLRDPLPRLEDDFLPGTFAPSRRASERPMATACFRLVTFLPLRPILSLPCFISCISSRTFFCAFGPYFLPPDDR